MTNSLVPTVTITLDRERTMRMDMNAFADFEAVTHKSFMNGSLDLANLTSDDMRALIWACLVQDDESLTQRDVGKMLHMGNLAAATNLIAELFTKAMPEPEEGSGDLPLSVTPPSDSTGAPSGRRRSTTSD